MRILVVKLSSIGDIVHAMPAVSMLRRCFPQAKIQWVVERRASEVLEGCPILDELITIDTRSWRRSFSRSAIAEARSTLRQLRSIDNGVEGDCRDTSIAVDFQGLLKSGLIGALAGARFRFGFETSELREKASSMFLNHRVPTSSSKHVIDKNLALAYAVVERFAGNALLKSRSEPKYDFPIRVSSADELYVDTIIKESIGGFAIINPGGGWPTKLWDTERYAQTADWLWEQAGLRSLITYGPGEERLAFAIAQSSQTGAAQPVQSTLKQFVALARRAELFIGGDTGPLHIAAACGTRVVGLYGPTSPERNGPFARGDLTVERNLWCRAQCHRRSCWHWECMDIPVSAVTRAVEARLQAGAVL